MRSIFDRTRGKRDVVGVHTVLTVRVRHVVGRATVAALVMAVMAVVPQVSQTQQPHPARSDSAASGDSRVAQLAGITTDTGDFAPGHRSFSRYTTPVFCLVAVHHALYLARRSIAAQEALDSLHQDLVHDTLPAEVVAVARGCLAQFTVAGTAISALPDLFDLALAAEQDSLAAVVLVRRLALASGSGVRATLLLDALQRYLHAEPARLQAADALVTRLDALGSGSAVLPVRILAHHALKLFGDSTADAARTRREATQVITLTRALRGDSLTKYAEYLVAAYRSLLTLAHFYAHGPDSLRVIAQQFRQDIRSVPSLKGDSARPLDDLIRSNSPWELTPAAGGSGQPTPPLRADFWFPVQDTVLPVPGHVSLFVEVPENCYSGDESGTVLDPIGWGCQQLYNTLRRWHARYGAALDLTLVAWTSDKKGTVLSGPQTPAEAARNLQWYFLEYLKLPVQHLAVQVVPEQAPLPALDGRILFPQPYSIWAVGHVTLYRTPFILAYHLDPNPASADLVLTGRDGRTLYAQRLTPLFDQILAHVVAAPTLAPPTGPTASAHPQPSTK